jgi:Zn-dependent protease with chaperone function
MAEPEAAKELLPGFSRRFVWGRLFKDLLPLAVMALAFAFSSRRLAAPALLFLAVATIVFVVGIRNEAHRLQSLAKDSTPTDAVESLLSESRRERFIFPFLYMVIGLLMYWASGDRIILLAVGFVAALELFCRSLKWLVFDRWLERNFLRREKRDPLAPIPGD